MKVGFIKGISNKLKKNLIKAGNFYLSTDDMKLYLAPQDNYLIDLNSHTIIINSMDELPLYQNNDKKIYIGETYFLNPMNMFLICIGIESDGKLIWKQVNQNKLEWGIF